MTTPNSRTGIPGFDQFFSGRVREGGRVRTGIAELNEMLRGGFMEGDAGWWPEALAAEKRK